MSNQIGMVATYVTLVKKPNKQGNSQSTAQPQHHPIPKLLHIQPIVLHN